MEEPNNMAQGTTAAPDGDRMKQLQFQVNDVKNIMAQNIEQIMTRDEKLEDLRNKSEDMNDRAKEFKHTTTKVARAYWWKNAKLMVVIFVIVAIIILIIVLLATGVIPTGK